MQIAHALLLIGWYSRRPLVLDSLVYLLVFTGVARVTLGRRYPGRGGRAITIGVGLALTVAASVSAARTGFTLERLAPLSWVVLGSVLLILVLALVRVPDRRGSRSDGQAHHPPDQRPGQSSSRGGHSFSFHLHTDRMPNPGGPRGSRDPSSAEGTEFRREAGFLNTHESMVLKLLDAFAEHVRLHGLDHHPESFLIAVARTQRRVERHYHRLLVLLARCGWRTEPGKHHLAEDIESILQRVARNTGLFHEAMRIAEAAIHGGNRALLEESIAQMQLLERESHRLASTLEAMIARLEGDLADDKRSSKTPAHPEGEAGYGGGPGGA